MPARRAAASKASGLRQRVAAALAGLGRQVASRSRKAAPGMCPARQARSPAPGWPSVKRQSTTRSPGVAEPLAEPRRLHQRAHARSVALRAVRAMVLDGRAGPLRRGRARRSRAGARASCCSRCRACGVCRTDLHILDGELPRAEAAARAGPPDRGARAARRRALRSRARAWACPGSAGPDGECRYCRSGRENLCERAVFTGYERDGGYAELRRGRRALLLPAPRGLSGPAGRAAPVRGPDRLPRRCGMAGDAERLGIYGFGAAAHIVCQVARHEGRRVFAFTRAERRAGAGLRARAGRRVGGRLARPGRPRSWTPRSIFAPAGELVPAALRAVGEGRQRRVRRHPHERHPVVPVRAALGRARAALGGQPHARGRRGVPGARAARAGADPGGDASRSSRRTRRSSTSARATCAGRRCVVPVGLRRRAGSGARAPAGGAARRAGTSASASATARQPAASIGHAAVDASISTCFGVRVEAGAPVHDAVALRVDRSRSRRRSASARRGRPRSTRSSRPRGRSA